MSASESHGIFQFEFDDDDFKQRERAEISIDLDYVPLQLEEGWFMKTCGTNKIKSDIQRIDYLYMKKRYKECQEECEHFLAVQGEDGKERDNSEVLESLRRALKRQIA